MIREIEYLDGGSPFARAIEYYEGDKVIGYLNYSLIYDRIEIDDFFVMDDRRDNRIGTRLMSYLIWAAIDNHVVNITLEVKESNQVAIDLYKRFGFKEVALRKFYYGNEHGILMEKQVM